MIRALHAEGRPRVWSLIVTVLGDAAEPHGGNIASARLAALLARIDIAPGAMRAALSRLVGDGWLERSRQGRSSSYRLGRDRGQAFHNASRRIYAPPVTTAPDAWVLGVGEEATTDGGVRIAPGVVLWPAGLAPAPSAGLRITGRIDLQDPLPLPRDHRDALDRMRGDLSSVADDIDRLQPLDAMAARMLLVHRWRRLVLRYPDLPVPLDPSGATNLRHDMARAYGRLLPASEAWLEQPGEGFDPMPVANFAPNARFSGTRPGSGPG